MKKFQGLGRVLSKNEQSRIKGGCTPEEMCDPDDILACGGLARCNCSAVAGHFDCCRNALAACVANHGCGTTSFACA